LLYRVQTMHQWTDNASMDNRRSVKYIGGLWDIQYNMQGLRGISMDFWDHAGLRGS